MKKTHSVRGIPVALYASLGSLALLAACGGGGSGSTDTGGGSATTGANTQVTGKAIDGYTQQP